MYKKLDEKTIEAILESGIDVFVEKGLRGAGMNEIAKRSGVSVGVIYKYFSDKDSFFLHCRQPQSGAAGQGAGGGGRRVV